MKFINPFWLNRLWIGRTSQFSLSFRVTNIHFLTSKHLDRFRCINLHNTNNWLKRWIPIQCKSHIYFPSQFFVSGEAATSFQLASVEIPSPIHNNEQALAERTLLRLISCFHLPFLRNTFFPPSKLKSSRFSHCLYLVSQAFHRMRGSVLGPLSGWFWGVFFFLVETPLAFCRFSAAARRASLCLSRSEVVRDGSTRFAGRSTSWLRDPELAAADCDFGSFADPSLFPFGWWYSTETPPTNGCGILYLLVPNSDSKLTQRSAHKWHPLSPWHISKTHSPSPGRLWSWILISVVVSASQHRRHQNSYRNPW